MIPPDCRKIWCTDADCPWHRVLHRTVLQWPAQAILEGIYGLGAIVMKDRSHDQAMVGLSRVDPSLCGGAAGRGCS